MTNQKQSNFTTVQELGSDTFIPAFSSSENEKISRDNLFEQIRQAVEPKFIYRTIDLLQAAPLEADPDEPTYVRCEETEYRLYKITSLAPGVDDIALNNGTTATYQIEYRDNGFVIGPGSSTVGAIAVFSDTSGETLAEGATPTAAGNALIEITSVGQKSYPRINTDDSVTAITVAQLQTDLNLPANTSNEITDINNDISAIEAELLEKVTTVTTFADLATISGIAGQTVYVNGVAAEGFGAGSFILKTGSVATVNGIRINIATANTYAERIDIGGYTIEMAGGRDDGVVDNKAPHEIIRGLGRPVIMMGTGTYLFSAPPTLPSTTNTILNGVATLSGVTASQLNATIIKDGNWCGMPFAQAIRDKRIGIVCGTIRAHQPQAVVSITRSGSTATVTHIAHGYSTGMPAVIAGANETEYNTAGSSPTTITVIDPDTYTYTVSGTPASPATGTITSRNPSWWFYINDADHTPLGMTTSGIYNPITGTSSLLTLGMDNAYTKVLSVVVCPDETLSSAQGMSIGPSVSLNGIALRASCDRTFAYEILYNSGTGLWSFSSSTGQDLLESFTYASGNLVINHKYCPKVNLQLTPYSRNGTVVPYIPVIKALTNTSFTVNFLDYVSGGLVVTTADDKMSMYASKNFNNLVPFDGSSGSWSIPFYLGNIWFLGIMQY